MGTGELVCLLLLCARLASGDEDPMPEELMEVKERAGSSKDVQDVVQEEIDRKSLSAEDIRGELGSGRRKEETPKQDKCFKEVTFHTFSKTACGVCPAGSLVVHNFGPKCKQMPAWFKTSPTR